MSEINPKDNIQSIIFAGIPFRYGTKMKMLDLISQYIQNNKPANISYINPHVYNLSNTFPETLENIKNCDFVCVDGIGISGFGFLFYGKTLPRVVANELFNKFLESNSNIIKAIVIGNSENEAKNAALEINKANEKVEILASWDGFKSDDCYFKLLNDLNENPDLILIGCGNPRSDQIMKIARGVFPKCLLWHVGGGTLRVFAGTKRPCPKLISEFGLEWLHRFILESKTRKRYSLGIIKFFANVLKNLITASPKMQVNESIAD